MINKIDNRFLLIGIGVMFYLFLTTYSFLFQDFVRLVALNFLDIPSIPLFFFIQVIYIMTIILFCYFFQNKLKNNTINSKKLFVQLAIAMILGQFLQFVNSFVFNYFQTSNYIDKFSAYLNEIQNDYALGSVSPILSLLVDLFLIYFFYKNRNSILKLDSQTDELESIGQ